MFWQYRTILLKRRNWEFGMNRAPHVPEMDLLIVCSSSIRLRRFSRHLVRAGYRVHPVRSFEAARSCVGQTSIEVVLFDIQLALSDTPAGKAAWSLFEDKSIPVIFLTRHSCKKQLNDSRKFRSYGYVAPRCKQVALIQTIDMAIALHGFHSQAGRNKMEAQEVVDNIDNAVLRFDVDGRIIFFNKGAENIFGYTADEVLGKKSIETINPKVDSDGRDHEQLLRDIFNNPDKYGYYENENRTKEGKRLWVAWRNKYIYDSDGRMLFIQSIGTDTTEKIRMEKISRKNEIRYRNLMENSIDAVYLLDQDGVIISANKKAFGMTGYPKEEIAGKRFSIIDPKQEQQEFRRLWEENRESVSILFESEHVHKSGNRIPVEVNAIFFSVDDENCVFFVCRDLTSHIKALEEKNFLMQELNHRVKNNLMMISSLINLKDDALEERVDLSDIRHQVDAIRIVHEKMVHTRDVTHVEIRDYCQDILDTVFAAFPGGRITIENRMEQFSFKTRTAVPVGLIVNEMATNAIKHGFTPGGDFLFSIGLKKESSSALFTLTLSNTGAPLPGDISLDNPSTLGLRLISALVEQLNGTITMITSPHPLFTIQFPAEQ